MDKWKCTKCGNTVYIQPTKNAKCDNCKKAKYQIIRICKCGKEFHPERYTRLYCSKECGINYQGKGGKKGKKYPHTQRARIGVCEVCRKEYRAVKDFDGRKSKYCSKECWSNRRIDTKKNCLYCGKEIVYSIAPSSKRLFCTRECSAKYKVGENAPTYKNGKSLLTPRGKDSGGLQRRRKAIYKRDNFTCQECGSTENINAHHIDPYDYNKSNKFDIGNGVTLCFTCHSKKHKKAVKRHKTG